MKESTNVVRVVGTVISRTYGYKTPTGDFDFVVLEMKRLNKNNSDKVNVYCKNDIQFNVGDKISVAGSFRSRTVTDETGSHCNLYVQASSVEIMPQISDDINSIELEGFLCKKPLLRKTLKGKTICDLLIATHRKNGKSDYLPLIAWRDVAEDISKFDVGAKLNLKGRIQSRTYLKNGEEKTAFEISVTSFSSEEK